MANMIQSSYGKMGMPQRNSVERQQISRTGGGTFTSPGMPSKKAPTFPTGRRLTTPGRIEAPEVELGGGGGDGGSFSSNPLIRKEQERAEYFKYLYGFDPRAESPERIAKGKEDYTRWLRGALGYSGFAGLGGDLSKVDPYTQGRWEGERSKQEQKNMAARERGRQAGLM